MVVLCVVLVSSILAPSFALRLGAVLCLIVVLFSLVGGFKLHGADVLAVSYAALAGASLLWTSTASDTLIAFLNAGACTIVFIAARAAITRRRDYLFLASSLILAGVASVAGLVARSGQLRWTYDALDDRIGIDGININYTAYSLTTVAVVALSLLRGGLNRKGKGHRIPIWGLLATLYLGVALNGTRGALVAMALLAFWWLLSPLRMRLAYASLVIVFVVTNIAMLVGLIDALLGSRVSVTTRDTGDLNGRLTIWPIARELFWEAPLFGHGAGSFRGHPANPFGIGAHAAVLDIGAGLGAAGLILFMGSLWLAIAPRAQVPSGLHDYRVSGAIIAATTPILLSGFWTESPVLWAAVGVLSRHHVLTGSANESEHKPSRATPKSRAAHTETRGNPTRTPSTQGHLQRGRRA